MAKVYSPSDAQKNLLELLHQVKTGKTVKIEATQQAGNGAVLVSEDEWAAMQKQLTQAKETQEVRQRTDLYNAWRWL